jgi:hypothetical protein
MAEIFSYSETFTITNYEIGGKSISDEESLYFKDSKEKNISRTLPQSINIYTRPRTEYQTKTVRIPALGNIQQVASGLTFESVPKYAPGRTATNSIMYLKTHNNNTYYLRQYKELLQSSFFVTYIFHRGMTQPFKWDLLNPNFPHVLPNAYTLIVNDFLSIPMIGHPLGYSATSFEYIQTLFTLNNGNEILSSLIYFFQNIHTAEDLMVKARPPIGNMTDKVTGFPTVGLIGDQIIDGFGWKIMNLPLRSRLVSNGKRFFTKSGIHTMVHNYNQYFDYVNNVRWDCANEDHSKWRFYRPNTEYRINYNGNPHYSPYHNIYVAEKGKSYKTYWQFPPINVDGWTFKNKDIYPQDWRIFCGMTGKAYWNYTNQTNTTNPLGFPSYRDKDMEFPAVTLSSYLFAFDRSTMCEDAASIFPFTSFTTQGMYGLFRGTDWNQENVYSPVWMPTTAHNANDRYGNLIVESNPEKLITLMSWRSEYISKMGGYARKNMLYLPSWYDSENTYYKNGIHLYNDLYRTTGNGNEKYITDAIKMEDKKDGGGVDTAWYYTNWLTDKIESGNRKHLKKYLDGSNISLKKINESTTQIYYYKNTIPPVVPSNIDLTGLNDSHYAPGQQLKNYWANHKKFQKIPIPIAKVDNFTLAGGKNTDVITAMSPDSQEESIIGSTTFTYGVDFDNYRIYSHDAIINVRPFVLGENDEKIYDGIQINSISIIDQTGKIYNQLNPTTIENITSFTMPMQTISRYSKRYLNFIIEDFVRTNSVILRYPFIKDSMDITEIQNTSISKVLN